MQVKSSASASNFTSAATTQAAKNPGRESNIARFSPGSRINSSSEDAAGLEIAERLKSELTSSYTPRARPVSVPSPESSAPDASGGVSNTAGAPENGAREQAIQRYRDSNPRG